MNDEIKERHLIDSYKFMLEIYKIGNDNYFKRVQLFMGVLHIGIFISASKLFVAWASSTTINTQILNVLGLIVLSVFGVIAGVIWGTISNKQGWYLEFYRRSLRNLEKALIEKNIPMEYFITEGIVFSGKYKGEPNLLITEAKGNRVKFKKIDETYPETDGIHAVGKVKGGMAHLEGRLAWGVCAFWSLATIFLCLYLFLFSSLSLLNLIDMLFQFVFFISRFNYV